MEESVIKEEVIEETYNFTFKNGEYVEVKQEEVEQKPENLLEKEIKTETNDDFFETNESNKFFEDVEPEPNESDYEIEKRMYKELGTIKCKICQKRMPRKLLKLMRSEDDKNVLFEIFNAEGILETRANYVCHSHIQTIIDDKDGKLKTPNTAFRSLLRSFIKRNRRSMRYRTSQKICHICHMPEDLSKLYCMSSKGIRMVIMVGCILRGTHSVEQAKSYITNNARITCYSHCTQAMNEIFVHLGVRNIEEFWNCPVGAMDDLMEIVKRIDSNFTAEDMVLALHSLFAKKPKI
ncbi:unnamed protein product [Caenorhabditis nigoni]